MTDYTINTLRADLAATIRALHDPKSGMTVDKAKAIGELAQTMINSAKVEVEALKLVGRSRMKPTGFIAIESGDTPDQQDPAPKQPLLESPAARPHVRNPVGSAPRGSL